MSEHVSVTGLCTMVDPSSFPRRREENTNSDRFLLQKIPGSKSALALSPAMRGNDTDVISQGCDDTRSRDYFWHLGQ